MNVNGYHIILDSPFRFCDDNRNFFSTPVESILNYGGAWNVGALTCYLVFVLCGGEASISTQNHEYHDVGVVECLPIQFSWVL